MKRFWILKFGFWLGASMLTGCIMHEQNPAATQPATAVDLATTQPDYWLAQPATASVNSTDFQKLWDSCEMVARDFLFDLDREDYRSGLLTTKPLVSPQWFEIWHRDARTWPDREESNIATIRRTIRFEFTKLPDDTWQVTPKVLVEKQAISEKRITSVVLFRSVFTEPLKEHQQQHGTKESDEGIVLPERYWYLLRRDTTFEAALARAVQKKLNHLQS